MAMEASATAKLPNKPGKGDKICASTMTYMLDGKVGLMADLALMAQVAALAREVGDSTQRRCFLILMP